MKNKLLKRSNGGFSLVELIVVIAIMAILVGVAVPVYTSYIEKAQKNKDIQMVDEVKHALEIALIATNPQNFAGGVAITFDTDGCELVGGSDADRKLVDDAMKATFGAEWKTDLKLSYSDWEEGTAQAAVSAYVGSTYEGQEEVLLDRIQELAGVLSATVDENGKSSLVGKNYQEYLDQNGITGATAIGNAAILYVAGDMGKVDQAAVAAGMVTLADNGDSTALVTALSGTSTATKAAAVYAAYESLFMYVHQNGCGAACTADVTANATTCPLAAWHGANFSNVTQLDQALPQIATSASGAWNMLDDTTELEDAWYEYCGYYTDLETMETKQNVEGSQAYRDALAYAATLTAIKDSEEKIKTSIDQSDCFSSDAMYTTLQEYIALGSAKLAVITNCDKNGVISVTVYPSNIS